MAGTTIENIGSRIKSKWVMIKNIGSTLNCVGFVTLKKLATNYKNLHKFVNSIIILIIMKLV